MDGRNSPGVGDIQTSPSALMLDWRKSQHATVQLEIEKVLDKLPPKYDTGIYQQKCQLVYQHVYDSYYGAGRSIYAAF